RPRSHTNSASYGRTQPRHGERPTLVAHRLSGFSESAATDGPSPNHATASARQPGTTRAAMSRADTGPATAPSSLNGRQADTPTGRQADRLTGCRGLEEWRSEGTEDRNRGRKERRKARPRPPTC